MMQALTYYLVYPFLYLISLLPFRVIYLLSDGVYLVMRLVRYRGRVINDNLRYSFPEKSEKEIRHIQNLFYSHFCDIFFETIKLMSMSETAIKKRVTFENLEAIDKAHDENKDVIMVMAHYGCWEWVPSVNLHIKAQACAVYQPLKNKYFDKFMLNIRSRYGEVHFPMKSTLREVLKLRKSGQRYVLGLISDQSPARVKIQYWTRFLNQQTPVFLGAEKMAHSLGDPVMFLKMEKVKRGYYKVSIIPLFDKPKETSEYEITEAHLRILEQQIQERPEHWLWSHKRWKYAVDRTSSIMPQISNS
jgi:KDO2-lipid IV(A) lauroyltransferase